jgi:hypothetical protein
MKYYSNTPNPHQNKFRISKPCYFCYFVIFLHLCLECAIGIQVSMTYQTIRKNEIFSAQNLSGIHMNPRFKTLCVV